MKHTFKKIPFYTFLFPALTVLMLAVNNLGEIELSVIVRPTLLSIIVSLPIFLIAWKIFRDIRKAGAVSFGLVFFALTYGHFFSGMKDRVIGHWVIGTHLYMLLLWGGLAFLVSYLFITKFTNFENFTFIMNIVLVSMVLFQISQITVYSVRAAILDAQTGKQNPETFLQPEDRSNLPDVYFIILDKYARQDAIKDFYEYDNSAFINNLEDLGFWVADCSRTNYAFTVMSLSSQLNMAYVEDLTDDPSLQTTRALIQNNKVHQAFEEIGYTSIAFDMGFTWGNHKNADIYFDEYPEDFFTWHLDPFEILYLKTTLGIFIFERDFDLSKQAILNDIERKAERTRLILDLLPEIPQIDGPKFIHAHIITPHPPYIFNPDGSLNPNYEDISDSEGYIAQLEFIEPRIIEVIKQIIQNSKKPPIIILEGDHGFGKKYVTSNLLALYLPDVKTVGLPENTTLINVFPYIFNTYFNAEIPYMPDISYTHTDDWYESVPLEEWNPACQGE